MADIGILTALLWLAVAWMRLAFSQPEPDILTALQYGIPLTGLLVWSAPRRARWPAGIIGTLFVAAWIRSWTVLPPALRWAWLHQQESAWQCLAFVGIPCGLLALWLREIAAAKPLSRASAARLGGWTFFFLTIAVSIRCLALTAPPRHWILGLTLAGCLAFWIPAWAWRHR